MAPGAIALQAQGYRWPVDNPSIGQVYGCRRCIPGSLQYQAGINFHTGADVKPVGAAFFDYQTPVKAAADGWIVKTVPWWASHKMGNTVIIQHADGKYSLYGHLDSIDPATSVGKFVTQGTTLGIMGNSSGVAKDAFGTHVHFEIKDNAALGNLSDSGRYWGYTPGHPDLYGYQDPRLYVAGNTVENITPVAIENLPPGALNVRSSAGLMYESMQTSVVDQIGPSIRMVAYRRMSVGAEYWYFIHLPSANLPIDGVVDGVTYPNNGPNGGWVAGSEIALRQFTKQIVVSNVSVGGLHVRAGPGTNYTALAKLYDGQRFVSFDLPTGGPGCTTVWRRILLSKNVGQSDGWVCGQLSPGDLNSDGFVNVVDLGILLSNWNRTGPSPADINKDGIVNVIDLGILLSNWG